MAARIRSTVNGINPLDEQSREDVSIGNVVSVVSIDGATTYNWELSFVPEGSTATFSGTSTDASPGSFTVDLEGPYLVKLTTDTGLITESVQYVRVRVITSLLGLKLVAGGERRDPTGIIPIDIDIEGWANDQNSNLQKLEVASTSITNTPICYLNKLVEGPNTTVTYSGWVNYNCSLTSVTVKMDTVNTQGNYTLQVSNVGTGNTCLSGLFDMNTLVDGVVSIVPLTSVVSDLSFVPQGSWTIELVSDSISFDGSGIYVQLNFEVV